MERTLMKTKSLGEILVWAITIVVFLSSTTIVQAIYDPQLMRFTARDPDKGSPQGPMTLHRYLYCQSDPINNIDLTGESYLNVGNGLVAAADVYSLGLTVATYGAATSNLDLIVFGAFIQEVFTPIAYMMGMGGKGGLGGEVCFPAGTEVLTACGEMPIEKIQPGWYVWAVDPNTDKTGLFEVTKCFKRETDKLVIITAGDTVMKATPEHPFYIYDQGWCLAGNLTVGIKLVDVNNMPVVVDKIEFVPGKTTVYNFEVECAHSYYVSPAKLLVHNNPCGMPGKPNGSLKRVSDKWLKGKGLNPHELKKGLDGAKLDIYKDKSNGLWTKGKRQADEFAQWLGFISDLTE
jgi:hypothetical protein